VPEERNEFEEFHDDYEAGENEPGARSFRGEEAGAGFEPLDLVLGEDTDEDLESEIGLEEEGSAPAYWTPLPFDEDTAAGDEVLDAEESGESPEWIPAEFTTRSDPITTAVRDILVRRLNPRDPIGSRKLKEMGGGDPTVRKMIVGDLNTTWPRLRWPFQERDISGEDTLASISLQVRRRM
jgi:hypothetical protein